MAEQYSREIAKVAVAQIAEATGFQAAQGSAVEVLGDLLLRYLSQLGTAAHSNAEQAGRTEVNLNDVVRGAASIF